MITSNVAPAEYPTINWKAMFYRSDERLGAERRENNALIVALADLVEAFVNPHDGAPFEVGEVPVLDRARLVLNGRTRIETEGCTVALENGTVRLTDDYGEMLLDSDDAHEMAVAVLSLLRFARSFPSRKNSAPPSPTP